ncbi:MAG: carbohydrate binding domain-containing protein [Treponema sp.]|nr:carbohydrate binding domain-containing protein [Candidatus Treponema equifaecale]
MKGKIALLGALAALTAGTSVFAQSNYTDSDLVWTDDFNSGKTINEKFWSYEPHEPGWVNNELQSYGKSTSNTYVKDGNLVIQPIRTENKDGSYSYTSGRINTLGKKHFKYGRFEARIKFPKGKGFLPAFWMMPIEESYYGNWPKCGEIDIAEVLGHETNTLYGTIHYGEPHAQKQGIHTIDGDFNKDFHVFAVEWEPGEFRYYCDGVMYKKINGWFTKKPGFGEVTYPAPFDQEFYIILNVAVGGTWPGNPDDDTEFGENAQMLVDYVKVFQKKSYDENVKKPEGDKIVLNTDASGNLVKPDAKAWQFLTAGSGKGALKVSNGELTISSTDAGNLDYSVQVVQPEMPMEQGKVYKYSFDAYADEERTMITGITAPNANYIRMFGDVYVPLTKSKQHFEYVFNQLDNSDAHCRVEYNLGNQDSVATVHVSNIRLEQIGDVDYSKLNAGILPDGNYVHNGQFQEGENRLGYWELVKPEAAQVFVTNDDGKRELKIVNAKKSKPADLQVVQKKLRLPAGKDCVLRFDARSTKTTRVEVTLGDQKFIPMLMKTPGHFEYVFKAGEYGEDGAELNFKLGVAGATIFLDNVSVKENIVVLNGEFDNDMAAFEVYAHENARVSYKIDEESGNKLFAITIDDTGNMDWMIQLKQNNVILDKGKKYRVSLRAKADMDRMIMYALQRDGSKDDNWDPYSGTIKFNLTKDWQTFGNTFTMGKDSDQNVIFTISMGSVGEKRLTKQHTVYIDSIIVEQLKDK